MALEIEYLCVVIKDSSIRSKYHGGIDQFIKDADLTHEEDGEIHVLSFMDPGEAEDYINLLVKRGLIFRENRKSIDIAVCDMMIGIRGECDWLTIEEKPGCNPRVSLSADKRSFTLEGVINYSSGNERICPQPVHWSTLYEKLRGKKRVGAGWDPPLPLILAAWSMTSENDKKLRFIEHLTWADKHGQLKEIADYLYGLQERQWFHRDE